MALVVMADNNIDIPASSDGAMYNVFAGDKDFVIDGIGDELEATYTGLNATVKPGECVICGRHVVNDSETTLTLPANSTGHLCIRIDLSQPAGTEAILYATPTLSAENLNNGGIFHDLPLYSFVTSGSAVTSFVDERTIYSKTPVEAASVILNNTDAGMTAKNVQAAFKELNKYVINNNYTGNVNDIKEFGGYLLRSGFSGTPSGVNSYAQLFCLPAYRLDSTTNARVSQIIINNEESSRMWVRQYRNTNGWTAWREVSFEPIVTNNSYVDISSYNSTTKIYTTPSDGYIFLVNGSNQTAYAAFIRGGGNYTSGYFQMGGVTGRFSVFAKKGTRVYLNGTAGTFRFIALES